MIRRTIIKFAALLAVIGFAAPANAQGTAEELVLDISQDVLERVRTYGPSYDENPQILQDELLKLLDPVIDFESFSRGVMGTFYEQASSDQRGQFMSAFKATLVDLYTTTLVIYEISEITLRETINVSPTSARVSVDVATLENGSYVVQYNMRKDDTGKWMARNIILDGINIGLTYRNQFQSAMESENQDLDRVIVLWPELIDGR